MTSQLSPNQNRAVAHSELPSLHSHPNSKYSWEHFGAEDELGTFNRLTPDHVRTASATVSEGKVFSMNWSVELPDPPLFSRRPVHRTAAFGYGFADDKLDDFYLQGSTQWDSLAHARNPAHGYYNDPPCTEDGLVAGNRGGIQVWARRGIAARFVLADVARWRAEQGRPIDPRSSESIPREEVVATLAAQQTTIERGDILLLRFGWIGWYEQATLAERTALADNQQPASPGLASGVDTSEWLWDSGIAAVVADNPAVEATPTTDHPYESLHFTVLPLLGIPLGELFVLDALASDCAADGRYYGLLTSAPLNVAGGVGSPANALCIK